MYRDTLVFVKRRQRTSYQWCPMNDAHQAKDTTVGALPTMAGTPLDQIVLLSPVSHRHGALRLRTPAGVVAATLWWPTNVYESGELNVAPSQTPARLVGLWRLRRSHVPNWMEHSQSPKRGAKSNQVIRLEPDRASRLSRVAATNHGWRSPG